MTWSSPFRLNLDDCDGSIPTGWIAAARRCTLIGCYVIDTFLFISPLDFVNATTATNNMKRLSKIFTRHAALRHSFKFISLFDSPWIIKMCTATRIVGA